MVPKINRLSIKNKKRFLPEGLVYIYCREILDDDTHCTYGKNYCFMHILLPKDFTDTEILHINKWLIDTNGLSFKTNLVKKFNTDQLKVWVVKAKFNLTTYFLV